MREVLLSLPRQVERFSVIAIILRFYREALPRWGEDSAIRSRVSVGCRVSAASAAWLPASFDGLMMRPRPASPVWAAQAQPFSEVPLGRGPDLATGGADGGRGAAWRAYCANTATVPAQWPPNGARESNPLTVRSAKQIVKIC